MIPAKNEGDKKLKRRIQKESLTFLFEVYTMRFVGRKLGRTLSKNVESFTSTLKF